MGRGQGQQSYESSVVTLNRQSVRWEASYLELQEREAGMKESEVSERSQIGGTLDGDPLFGVFEGGTVMERTLERDQE